MQLHQHHYTSHLFCHSNSLSQSSSLREQSLHIFSSTIMFKIGLLLFLHLFVETPWCMLAENQNKLSSNILCWIIYPFLNGIETTKCFRKNPNWWYWWSSLREQSLHIFSSTIMFKTGLLLILHLFVEAPWCMLAENQNKLSSNILCWNIYPILNGIETTKYFRKNPNWWYWWSSWERGRAINTFRILFTHNFGSWMTF